MLSPASLRTFSKMRNFPLYAHELMEVNLALCRGWCQADGISIIHIKDFSHFLQHEGDLPTADYLESIAPQFGWTWIRQPDRPYWYCYPRVSSKD